MNEKLYSAWVTDVRKRAKLGQEKFGRFVCHYVQGPEGKTCAGYSRNQVGNWERGISFPENLESFISIALIDFDLKYPKENWDLAHRRNRCMFVNEKMYEILGMELYSRNLHEMLLMQVCRGILSFQDVLEMESELKKITKSVILDKEEKAELGAGNHTTVVEEGAFKCVTKAEIVRMVKENAREFQTGERSLGERFKNCFYSRQRYAESLSLSEAVQIYAPNYRGSYNRMFVEGTIKRPWLIDLCMHLRFDREEIQYILKCAHQVVLSDQELNLESHYRESYYPMGSVKWFKELEKKNFKDFEGRFCDFQLELTLNEKVSFKKKVLIAIILTAYVMGEYVEDLPPADYLLESLYFYDHGKEAVGRVEKMFDKIDQEIELGDKEILKSVRNEISEWIDYINENVVNSAMRTSTKKVYEIYRTEFKEYFTFLNDEISNISNVEKATKLHYLSALLYTVLTGKYYDHHLSQQDLDYIKRQMEGQVEEWNYIYNFFAQLLISFLNGEVLHESPNGGFYIMVDGKAKKPFEMQGIFEDLCETLLMIG